MIMRGEREGENILYINARDARRGAFEAEIR